MEGGKNDVLRRVINGCDTKVQVEGFRMEYLLSKKRFHLAEQLWQMPVDLEHAVGWDKHRTIVHKERIVKERPCAREGSRNRTLTLGERKSCFCLGSCHDKGAEYGEQFRIYFFHDKSLADV